MARDGIAIMQPHSLFVWTIRSIIIFMFWALAQLPDSWDVQVDLDQVVGAITMQNGSQRRNAGPWAEAPSTRRSKYTAGSSSDSSPDSATSTTLTTTQRSSADSRLIQYRAWLDFCWNRRLVVPHCFASAKDDAFVPSNGSSNLEDDLGK